MAETRANLKTDGRQDARAAVPLRALLDAATAAGIYQGPDDYLIPSQAPQRRDGDRDDRFLLRLVQEVAARVGVEAHVHAFRAAFAVYFLEHKPDQLVALQLLLGHASPETTRHYLRRLDRQRMMGEVRDLDWGGPAETVFEVSAVTEKEGFEPSFGALAAGDTVDTPREGELTEPGQMDKSSARGGEHGTTAARGETGMSSPRLPAASSPGSVSISFDLLGELLGRVRQPTPDVLHALLRGERL